MVSNRRWAEHTVDGPLGPLRVRRQSWTLSLVVEGPQPPAVALAMPDSPSAMLVVGDSRSPVRRPRAWFLRRRSRAVQVIAAGRVYELRPVSATRAQLLRDGTVIADGRGRLSMYSPWSLLGLSHRGDKSRLTWRQAYDDTDVAVGYALVIGYGAGALGFLGNMTILLFSVLGELTS